MLHNIAVQIEVLQCKSEGMSFVAVVWQLIQLLYNGHTLAQVGIHTFSVRLLQITFLFFVLHSGIIACKQAGWVVVHLFFLSLDRKQLFTKA